MSAETPAPATARPPPLGYAGKAGRYDECVDAAGQLRAPWADFFSLLGPDPAAALRAASDASHRSIIEQDVSMNVYSGEQAGAQPWPLDAVPMLIAPGEWATLTRGLRQRAHLLNELLLDLYGPQKLLSDGALPPALAMASPHFLRPCAGLGRATGWPFLHTYAVDLARSSDGQWWVIEDRLDAPSGLGYALQNRIITRQALPELFGKAPVERLYQFFRDFRASLEALSPRRESPSLALLTPGPHNESYFEHAYLARYLGYTLVEGEDLTTRDRQVFLRTVGGLKRVDVVVRRVDSDYCDPLELDGHSLLGVPGLLHAAHSGGVALANQIGARALETPALSAFLGPLCRRVLGEELQLPSAATWWCGHDAARDYVLEHLRRLVVRPVFRTPTSPPSRYGGWLGRADLATLADQIRAQPWAWCGQERVLHGTTPGWQDGALRPMPFTTRVFLAWQDGDYIVLPGGLTRCNPRGADMIVSLQQGSISKDTWVLHEGPPAPPPSLLSARPVEALRHPAATPSRTANNFFWLGRYLERAGQLARLLERLDPLLRPEIVLLDPAVVADTLRLVLFAQDTLVSANTPLERQAALARRVSTDVTRPASLAATLARLASLLDQLRVGLPQEVLPLLRELRRESASGDAEAGARLRQRLTALEGLTAEAMPRDTGWRFLDLGRRLERGTRLLAQLQALLHPADGAMPTEFRLQTLLHLSGSLFTYRSVYHGALDAAAVLDWLLLSPENPRGLRFQTERMATQLAELPTEPAPPAVAALRELAFRLVSEVRLADLPRLAIEPAEAAKLFHGLRLGLGELSEQLTQIYFSHAEFHVEPE